MEKKKPNANQSETLQDRRPDVNGSQEMEDSIERLLRKIPQITPPAGLLYTVMEAVKTRRISVWWRAYRWATSSISIKFTPLRLVPATALAAFLVLIVVSTYERGYRNIELNNSRELIPVEFTLDMPAAHSVHVAGSFNNWVPQPCELREENGSTRWILTLRLKPGRYEYAFVVDGRHIPHPAAASYQDDGFGNQNTVLALEREDDA